MCRVAGLPVLAVAAILLALPGAALASAAVRLRAAMDRLALLLVAAAVSLLVGCGGGADGGDSPLDNALGYLPRDAPLVVSIGTDLDGDQAQAIGEILDRFPFADQVTESIKRSIEEGEVNFDEDLRPLLGNEFVVGAADPRSIVGDTEDDFVAAIQAGSGDDLRELVEREDAEEVGRESDATLYEDSDGDTFAIEDDVLVVASSRRQLEVALAQRDADDRLTEDIFGEATDGLADDALVRLSGDLQSLIAADPETRLARRVSWVSALDTLGLTASFQGDAIDVDFRLGTGSEELAEEDLPIAAGEESPAVIAADGEVGVGIRDPGQILDFALGAGQAVDPARFGEFQTARRALEERADVDLEEDVLAQLEEGISMSVALDGQVALRAPLADPEGFDRTLAKLGEVLPDLGENATGETLGYAPPRGDEDFYALATADGEGIVYGVVNDAFVLANDAQRASTIADEPAETVDGAEGAIVVNASAERIVTEAISMFGEAGLGGALAGGAFVEPLGDITGSLSAETDGLTGRLTLTFD